jgi:hypothetical protein
MAQLAAFAQQRIPHGYRRQWTTPLESCAAKSRHQSHLGVDGVDVAHARSVSPGNGAVTSRFVCKQAARSTIQTRP